MAWSDLSLCANPEALQSSKPTGHPLGAPLRSWPLSRRSGRFPALPCLPPRPMSFYRRQPMASLEKSAMLWLVRIADRGL
jgi:hypothetical protein